MDDGEAAREPAGDVLERVAAVACRVAVVDEAVILLRGGELPGSLVAVARHGRELAPMVAWRAGQGIVKRALASGLPAAEGGRGRASAAAPLIVDGDSRGVLAVTAAGSRRRFDGEQLDLLAELATLVSCSLAERDLRARAEAVLAAGVEVLGRAVDMRDEYTGRHSAQVGALARRVGERIGINGESIELLACAARLHDVGKLGVPDAILRKPGPLDAEEWDVMRRHPDWGAEIVAGVPGLANLADLVRAHHERWDGGGYPHGLSGGGIPLASRVISVCDAYEAMVSQRPYRAPMSMDEALGELLAGAGSQFDPDVVAAVEAETVAAAQAAAAGLA